MSTPNVWEQAREALVRALTIAREFVAGIEWAGQALYEPPYSECVSCGVPQGGAHTPDCEWTRARTTLERIKEGPAILGGEPHE